MKPLNTMLLLLVVFLGTMACTPLQNSAKFSSNLDRIIHRGILRVGTSADMPPLNMLNKSGLPMGLDVDLAGKMAQAMGVSLRMVVKPFPDLLPALAAGEVDMIIAGMTITPERNLKAAFIGPYLVSGKALLTNFKFPMIARNLAELNSETFAYTALKESTAADLVKSMMPKARLIIAQNDRMAMDLLLSNQVDALVADYPVCVMALLQHPDKGLVSMITPFTNEPLGIAVPSGDAQMINWVHNALNTMREADTLIQLKHKWFEDRAWLSDLK